ncbi:MAG: hypothetical protein K2O01_05330 [Bacteroidales bacterium]|nr:hypothetical protein [Bacteroidales bacterium]
MAQLLETADDLRAEVAWATETTPTPTETCRPVFTDGEPPATERQRPTPPVRRRGQPAPTLPATQCRLLQIIGRENPAALALLAEETGRTLPDLLPDLLALELAGHIRSLPGERYEPV